MIDMNQTVFLVPALEFLQNVGGEREEGEKIKRHRSEQHQQFG
jgi:hypothetical protein